MNQILPISLQAMQNDSATLERIGTNVANIMTPGYRRQMALQAPLLPGSGLPGTTTVSSFAAAVAAEQASASTVESSLAAAPALHFDPRHGTIKTTDAPLDVALLGPGFFEVQTEVGPAWTRNGQFHLDARGTLVTAQGHAVEGRAGRITLAPGPVVIDGAGEVTQGGHVVAQLKVMDLDNAGAMSHPEGGLYTAASTPRQVADADVQVRQGALENSNVDHMGEMVQMVQVIRHFETMAKVVQGYDEMMGTAIHKLGEF